MTHNKMKMVNEKFLTSTNSVEYLQLQYLPTYFNENNNLYDGVNFKCCILSINSLNEGLYDVIL